MKTISRIALAVGLTTTLLVSGCGSDDDETAPPSAPTAVPDSAGVSPAAFMAFLLTLGSGDESSEPLTLSDSFAVPNDETSEPQSLM